MTPTGTVVIANATATPETPVPVRTEGQASARMKAARPGTYRLSAVWYSPELRYDFTCQKTFVRYAVFGDGEVREVGV